MLICQSVGHACLVVRLYRVHPWSSECGVCILGCQAVKRMLGRLIVERACLTARLWSAHAWLPECRTFILVAGL